VNEERPSVSLWHLPLGTLLGGMGQRALLLGGDLRGCKEEQEIKRVNIWEEESQDFPSRTIRNSTRANGQALCPLSLIVPRSQSWLPSVFLPAEGG
jgi:hypothetical protein